jgi:hypothetical protein
MQRVNNPPEPLHQPTAITTLADVAFEPPAPMIGQIVVEIRRHPTRCPAVIAREAEPVQKLVHAP